MFESDGKRTQVWRTDPTPDLLRMLLPAPASLPASLRGAKCVHVGVHPTSPPLEALRELREMTRASGATLSIETYTSAEKPVRE